MRPPLASRGTGRRRVRGGSLAGVAVAVVSLTAASAVAAAPATGSETEWVSAPGYTVDLLEGEGSGGRVAPLPSAFTSTAAGDDFVVTYTGFTPEAQAAFQRAVDIWSTQLDVDVPIEIDATFADLGERVLGSAGPTFVFTDTTQWFTVGLANQIVGDDLAPDASDITSQFSSTAPWHFDPSTPPPPGTFDFTTVVLHEITHGLGFTGGRTFDPETGVGSWGVEFQGTLLPLRYTIFAETGDGTPLTSLPNPSVAVGDAFTGGDLFFDGPLATPATADGAPAELYAPAEFLPGSSFAHLDEDVYPAGTLNALMTPRLAQQERIARPGPITLGILADQGWALQPGAFGANALTLTSVCSDDPSETRRWRVRNATSLDIPFTWDRYGTSISGDGVATAGDVFFETPASGGANTLRLFVDGVLVHTKASGGARC